MHVVNYFGDLVEERSSVVVEVGEWVVESSKGICDVSDLVGNCGEAKNKVGDVTVDSDDWVVDCGGVAFKLVMWQMIWK